MRGISKEFPGVKALDAVDFGLKPAEVHALIGINAGAVPGQTRSVIVNIGTIDLDCAATNTGQVKWTLFYVPIDNGASVVAA